MPALICGSLAFDTIMDFEGRFADHILPDQLHILNVSFLVPQLRRDFGGCAGNIAYAMRQFGAEPVPLAAAGTDAADYLGRLRALGICTDHIAVIEGCHTAQAMIMTDRDNNQITAFHPGAMSHAHRQPVPQRDGLRIGILAPDGRQAMIDHAAQMRAAGIPFVFDPGQGLPMFDGELLRQFIAQADWVTVNDYEGKLLAERTGWSCAEISRRVRGLVVTLGAQGCEVWVDGACRRMPPATPQAVVDPTGCGDAWRGALLWALEQGWGLHRAAALGNRVGAIKVASRGPQNWTLPPGFDPAAGDAAD